MAEDTQTESFLEPQRIVRYFGLQEGDHVADFGAGHGYFTIPMAKAVGGNGKVYAIDVQKSVLDIVRSRAKLEHLLNVEPLWADLDRAQGSKLKENFLEFVLMANVLFQSESRARLFEEAFRILRQGGRLAVVEWDQSPAPMGPPINLRVKKETVRSLAEDSGFEFSKEFEAGSHHYGLFFAKK